MKFKKGEIFQLGDAVIEITHTEPGYVKYREINGGNEEGGFTVTSIKARRCVRIPKQKSSEK